MSKGRRSRSQVKNENHAQKHQIYAENVIREWTYTRMMETRSTERMAGSDY